VDVRAASAELVDIHANDAFAEGVDGSEGDGASQAKSDFREQHILDSPFPQTLTVHGPPRLN
jgi:hypothetical protein